jgi:hypothetical protein
MPSELFVDAPPPDPIPEKPEDLVENEVVVVRASLDRLDAARRALDQLYKREVSALRLQPTAAELRDAETDGPEGAPVENGTQSAAGSQVAQDARPPWLLTEEDADELADLRSELDRPGVPLAGSFVREVANALDEAIAADTATLAAMEARVDILGIGLAKLLAEPPDPGAASLGLLRRQVSAGRFRILKGNVAEILSIPIQRAELTRIAPKYPNALLISGVRVRLMRDGKLSSLKLFPTTSFLSRRATRFRCWPCLS